MKKRKKKARLWHKLIGRSYRLVFVENLREDEILICGYKIFIKKRGGKYENE